MGIINLFYLQNFKLLLGQERHLVHKHCYCPSAKVYDMTVQKRHGHSPTQQKLAVIYATPYMYADTFSMD